MQTLINKMMANNLKPVKVVMFKNKFRLAHKIIKPKSQKISSNKIKRQKYRTLQIIRIRQSKIVIVCLTKIIIIPNKKKRIMLPNQHNNKSKPKINA